MADESKDPVVAELEEKYGTLGVDFIFYDIDGTNFVFKRPGLKAYERFINDQFAEKKPKTVIFKQLCLDTLAEPDAATFQLTLERHPAMPFAVGNDLPGIDGSEIRYQAKKG